MTSFAPTRRGVLAGLGGLGLMSFSAARAVPRDPDVVIVGAGAAGIGAAQTLMAQGLSVLMVEAAGRIGGRAYTDETTFDIPFDIGCAWLHASNCGRNPFYEFARKHDYDLRYHDLELTRVYYGVQEARRGDVAAEHAAEHVVHENVERLGRRHHDAPVSAAVPRWSPPYRAAATYMGPMDMGVDLQDLSVFDYDRSADLDPNYLIKQGYGALVAKVATGLPVKLATPVQALHYGERNGVRVVTKAGPIEARAAIVTVSTGVLASETIAFDPPLPDWKAAAIADLPMGLLAKIPLCIKGDDFGVKAFENIELQRPGKGSIYFLAWPFASNLMVGFVGGSFGWELAAAGEDAAINFAKERLRDLFGSKAPGMVTKALFTKWASNPLTRGAYAAATPGHYTARAALARPLNQRLFFAGEAVAPEGLIQTCNGAYLSGILTARDVADTLRGKQRWPSIAPDPKCMKRQRMPA